MKILLKFLMWSKMILTLGKCDEMIDHDLCNFDEKIGLVDFDKKSFLFEYLFQGNLLGTERYFLMKEVLLD
jgi:hypothetical protein